MQVKVISEYDEYVFEKRVSQFLKDNEFKKGKITYNAVFNQENGILYLAFIEYY